MISTSFKTRKGGYATLLSVLVAGAVAVAAAVSLLLLGLNSSRTSFALEQSLQAKSLANACVEEALQQIRTTASFSGGGSIPLGTGACTYNVINTGGTNRSIDATGTVGTVVRKVKVSIDGINPQIHIVSWQEVANL